MLFIKRGEVDLNVIIEEWGKKAEELEQLYRDSSLPDKVNIKLTKELELKIRNNEL